MLFLVRILVIIALIAGLGYAGLYALGTFVVPESREMVHSIPMPRPRS